MGLGFHTKGEPTIEKSEVLKPPPAKNVERDRLHQQLIKLGDMLGDGLGDEEDGEWIGKEYKKIYRKLYPKDFKRDTKTIDSKVLEYLKDKSCPKCEGELKQSRSGSYTLNCKGNCKSKFKIKRIKRIK